MNLTEEQKKGQEVFFRIISEAWENEDFKKSLLDNPEKTLEEFFEVQFPINKKIKVTDQSNPEYLYINIPIRPQINNHSKEIDSTKKNNLENKSRNTMNDYKGLYDSLKQLNNTNRQK